MELNILINKQMNIHVDIPKFPNESKTELNFRYWSPVAGIWVTGVEPSGSRTRNWNNLTAHHATKA